MAAFSPPGFSCRNVPDTRWQRPSEETAVLLRYHAGCAGSTVHPSHVVFLVSYNYDAMARYIVSSSAGGTQDAQTAAIFRGQTERSASLLLDSNLLSRGTHKQLKDTHRAILHLAAHKIPAAYSCDYEVANQIHGNHTLLTERLYEFFTEHLAGNWASLFTLISDHTQLALNALTQCINLAHEERLCIWNVLMEDAGVLNSLSSGKGICDAADDAYAQAKEPSSANTSGLL